MLYTAGVNWKDWVTPRTSYLQVLSSIDNFARKKNVVIKLNNFFSELGNLLGDLGDLSATLQKTFDFAQTAPALPLKVSDFSY